MNLKSSLPLIVLPFLLQASSCKKDQTQDIITNNPLKTEQDLLVHNTVKSFAEKKSTAGLSIGILKGDKVYHYGYGETVKGTQSVPDSNSIFEIGSITKTFTAALMINLLTDFNLTVDEPVNNLLPNSIPLLIRNNKKITVKHLLNHTSGLPRLPADFNEGADNNNPYKGYDSTRLYNALKTISLKSDPGEKVEYSNFGMALAGRIIERKSGKSYSEYLKTQLIDPLQLKRTSANHLSQVNVARGYTEKGKETPFWDLNAFAGAGCINSTVGDLLVYSRSLIHSDKSPKSDVFNKVKEVTYTGPDYKLASAWFYLKINGNECLVHDGGTGGFRSFIYILPAKEIALVVLSNNGSDAVAAVANKLAESLIR
jgi:CubicO group peptidase (beta-lactamase class C family)